MVDKHILWEGLLMVTVVAVALSGVQYAYRGLIILNSHEPQMFE